MLARIAVTLASAGALLSPCFPQPVDPVVAAAVLPGALHDGISAWSDDDLRHAATGSSMGERLQLFVDDAGSGQVGIGAGLAVVQMGRWRAFIGVENTPLTVAERIDAAGAAQISASPPADPALGAAAAALGHPGFGASMSPSGSSHQAFRQFTEFRMTSFDVLMHGDSLTLRAGSDLRWVLQGIGIGGWADDAAALVGWRSKLQLRWAKAVAVGELSLVCRVDRKANELGRGGVQARWEARF